MVWFCVCVGQTTHNTVAKSTVILLLRNWGWAQLGAGLASLSLFSTLFPHGLCPFHMVSL